MKSSIVFCLLLVALCCVAKECDKNEVFNPCGSACFPNEPSCKPAKPIEDLECAAVCVPMCVCADGFLRNSSNKCVTKENC
ncbi:PREDICTED: chymotrypsin inhibitor-like [Nicrophorus vespilloides]|uniref:Chymotrypsin inhibitor-like n=1 Tax=Nicrophorus vespilloides TaxID=110193 RepID=A0ABM1NJJ7_NICVS|nr:PREDICTED: chymotrypsin inhibitor-like [Nicrophorus vespilloides]